MKEMKQKCPHAKKCGGCQLQNMTYDRQLSFKQVKVIKLLGKYRHVDEIIGMDCPYHYRNKVQAAFGEKNGEIKINKALYVRKSIPSSETFHFIIIALMSAFILALGSALMFEDVNYWSIIISAGIGLAVWLMLLSVYFSHCIKVYQCLEVRKKDTEKSRDKAFNKVFSKAWFLHFYYDEK